MVGQRVQADTDTQEHEASLVPCLLTGIWGLSNKGSPGGADHSAFTVFTDPASSYSPGSRIYNQERHT